MDRDIEEFRISGTYSMGWYIYNFKKYLWLSSKADEFVSSRGANNKNWVGYYATKELAKERLEKYVAGKPLRYIRVGGE